MRSIKTIGAVLGLTLAGVVAAQAAQATTALNVRSGPGTGYGVVDVLSAGEQVDVEQCRGGWCRISHPGPDGWVSQRYLTDDNRQPQRPRPGNAQPDVGFSINTPNFSFSIGNGGNFEPPRRPGNRGGQVCFYEDFNYRGASFCARPGDSYRSLNRFNDRISSIRVRGNAQVQVCEDFDYRGRCAVLDRSMPQITGRNNDIISSIRVR